MAADTASGQTPRLGANGQAGIGVRALGRMLGRTHTKGESRGTSAPYRQPKRTSLVVLGGIGPISERPAAALATSLARLGFEAIYLGRIDRGSEIAAVADDLQADAIELCVGRSGGVHLLKELLRELSLLGRRDISIVLHRME